MDSPGPQNTDTQQPLSYGSDSELTNNRTHPRPRRQVSSVVSRHEFYYPPTLSDQQQFNSRQDSPTQYSQHQQYSHHIHHSKQKHALQSQQSQQVQKLVSPPPSPAVPAMTTKPTRKRKELESSLVLPSNIRRRATAAPDTTTTDIVKRPTERKQYEKLGGIKHVYSEEQDRFLAEILADDHINMIIQGTERSNLATPKCKIHQQMAVDFNAKFGTNLDGLQIKNKIANMQKIWKDASKYRDTSIKGQDDDELLRVKVMRRCNFYYIVEPTWSSSWVPPALPKNGRKARLEIAPEPAVQPEIEAPQPVPAIEQAQEQAQEPIQEPEVEQEQTHGHEEVEDEPELDHRHETDQENEPEIDEIQSESEFPINEQHGSIGEKQKLDHYRGHTSTFQSRVMESMDQFEIHTQSSEARKGEITEQELTKRILAEYSQTTKREELRVALERDKERTKQLELETKQLEIQLKIEHVRYDRVRLESERERAHGRAFSLG